MNEQYAKMEMMSLSKYADSTADMLAYLPLSSVEFRIEKKVSKGGIPTFERRTIGLRQIYYKMSDDERKHWSNEFADVLRRMSESIKEKADKDNAEHYDPFADI